MDAKVLWTDTYGWKRMPIDENCRLRMQMDADICRRIQMDFAK